MSSVGRMMAREMQAMQEEIRRQMSTHWHKDDGGWFFVPFSSEETDPAEEFVGRDER